MEGRPSVRYALDQGRSSCQEGPAEEGGASHPRSTVTHCHIWLKSYLGLAQVEQGSPRVAARRFCWDWVAVVQPRRAAELWVGPHSLFAVLQTTLAPRRAEATIPRAHRWEPKPAWVGAALPGGQSRRPPYLSAAV